MEIIIYRDSLLFDNNFFLKLKMFLSLSYLLLFQPELIPLEVVLHVQPTCKQKIMQ